MTIFILKNLLAAFIIVGFLIFRIADFEWSFESITAVGTLLTGVAALLAVFGSFYTMQHQVKKTAHADWLKSFRLEAANMLSLSQKLQQHSNVAEISEFTKSSMYLILLLNQTFPNHKKLTTSFKEFTIFLMASDFENPEFQSVFVKNWNSVLSLIMIVIDEEESRY